MSRVIALDLDDTLLRSDHSISGRTLEMLRAWETAGNHLVVATGRPPRSINAASHASNAGTRTSARGGM